MTDSAELIAKVVRDLRMGRYNRIPEDLPDKVYDAWNALFVFDDVPIIDATKLYENFIGGKQIFVYEDHVMCPPWPIALVCYVNDHGNVHVMLTISTDRVEYTRSLWQPKDQEHRIDWDKVEWIVTSFMWLGGRGGGQAIPTSGPCQAWDMAVNGDGYMQDLRWTNFMPDVDKVMWDNAIIAVLQTYNFMNCVNVEIAEPHRTRQSSRRIQREIGFTKVNEIVVRPISKSGTGGSYNPSGFQMPLHSVRGHFARYGPQYDRKLLFGKYSGRFWIPGHARGNAEVGVREHTYIIDPESS